MQLFSQTINYYLREKSETCGHSCFQANSLTQFLHILYNKHVAPCKGSIIIGSHLDNIIPLHDLVRVRASVCTGIINFTIIERGKLSHL